MTNTDLITVAISTIGSRVENISLPDQTDGVCYLILIQSAEPNHVDFFDRRPDVVVVAIEGIGLSNSRNRAIQLTVGDLLLFADDDTSLDVLGIQALARVLRLDAELAVVAGWRAEKIPQCAKSKRLTKLNSGRV